MKKCLRCWSVCGPFVSPTAFHPFAYGQPIPDAATNLMADVVLAGQVNLSRADKASMARRTRG
ncbi:MAG: hypothetical protein ABSA97_13350 [Verrucomicrobiia bacterium]